MNIRESFLSSVLPESFFWLNEPSQFSTGTGLEIFTDEKTDFWQRTHYGFQRDDGHCLFVRHTGDFSMHAHFAFQPHTQYDQCGLMVRADKEHWIKVSTEYEDPDVSRLGSVVTNFGYSDWATQDISSTHTEMWYRINKRGQDFLMEYSYDSSDWRQMRIGHIHIKPEYLDIGIYACSPVGKSFWCKCLLLEVRKNTWFPRG